MLRTLAPLALALALTACGGSDQVAAAPSAASIEKADLNGVIDMQKDLIEETRSILSGVEDEAGAKQAKPKIEALAESAQALGARLNELKGGTAEDKLAFGQSMMEMMGIAQGLSTELERLEGVAGVREQLEEPVTAILNMFSGR